MQPRRYTVVYEDIAAAASATANLLTSATANRGSTSSFRTKSASSLCICRSDDSNDEAADELLSGTPSRQRGRRSRLESQYVRDDVELAGRQRRPQSRRASLAAHLYSSLQRRRSMSRLSPLSTSLASVGEQELDAEMQHLEEETSDDDQSEDANNNPLERHQRTTSTYERSLKITPSIVRRLPIRPGANNKYFGTTGRIRKRVIHKNGNVNLSPEHVDKRHRRFMQDMFTTMVDIRWRWNLLVFAMGFLASWFIFAVVWWLIAFSHSDFEHITDTDWTPCVNNLHSFASAILFSIETQHTIGYGSRYTTEECPEAMFVMCLQSITGVMIQCFMVGFVFAKLSRPQKRSQTLMFSRHAVTCLRDGKLCLMFRVGDLRDKSHIIGSNITAQVIRRKITEEGENIPYYHHSLSVRFDDAGSDLFLIWPAVIIHEIDENSPFYLMNCEAMMKEKFEIVVILEGTVESTGQSIQARTSYLPSEILWGHRFENLIRYRNDTGEYMVDYSKFNNTFPVDIATYSGKEFHEDALHRERQKLHQYTTPPTSPPMTTPLTSVQANGPTVAFQSHVSRPNAPPPPPPAPDAELLTESQRERIKFFTTP